VKNKLSQGFTLIEVAIALLFITFLSLFVFPAYSSYVKKNQVEEGLALTANSKVAVTRAATSNAPLNSLWTPPIKTEAIKDMTLYLTDTTGISLSSHGDLIDKLPSHHAGEIVITFSSKIAPTNHNELVLSPRLADPNNATSNGHELPLDFSRQLNNSQTITWECNSAHPPRLNHGTHGNLDARLVPADCRT
jgi:Tfp pilus assembly major pilin PilA